MPSRPPAPSPSRHSTRHPSRYLERFFNPGSIAVIGASEHPWSLGGAVLNNLQAAGFPGPVLDVNPHGGDTVFDARRAWGLVGSVRNTGRERLDAEESLRQTQTIKTRLGPRRYTMRNGGWMSSRRSG